MASFHSNEIELEHECELDLQFFDSVSNFVSLLTLVSLSDLDPILVPTLTRVPIDLEHESPIFSHILLLEKECESQFFNLDLTLEPKPTLETKLDLSHIPESMLVLVPFIPKIKSSISQNHILLLDEGQTIITQ